MRKQKQVKVHRGQLGVAVMMGAMLVSGCATQSTQDAQPETAQSERVAEEQSEAASSVATQAEKAQAEAMMAKLSQPDENAMPVATEATEKQPEQPAKPTEATAPAKEPEVQPDANTVKVMEDKVVAESAAPVTTSQPVPEPQQETPEPAPVVEEKAPTAAEKAAAAVASLAAPTKQLKSKGKAFDVSIKDLPVSHGIWKIKRGEALMDKDIVIGTPTWEMGKPGYMSQIWVTVMDDKMLVNSSSDIDVKEGVTGVRFDGGDLIPFSRIEGNNIGVLDGDWLNTLQASERLDVYMGFFPGRQPRSDTFDSGIDLEGIERIVPTYINLIQ